MRISDQIAGFAQTVRRLGCDDEIVRFRPSADARRRWPDMPLELICRRIRYQYPGFRPSWLLTSLIDSAQVTREDLIDLYHRRWQIETIYREWKHSLKIQNIRSQTPAGVFKEVHAQLILANLVRWVMTDAVNGTLHTPVELSFTAALNHVKNALLIMRSAPRRHLTAIYQRLLQHLRTARIRKRPGRSYPRPGDGRIKNKGGGKYQQPAKLNTGLA